MHRLPLHALLLSLAVISFPCGAESWETTPTLTGGRFSYSVLPDDYLKKIAARFGVSAEELARDNGIANPDLIMPGQILWVDNRHIVPEALQNGIVINLPQRMLFYFQDGKLISAYPAGLGRPSWPTMQGLFYVFKLEKNPVWTVPKSIQEEMGREGQVVKTRVPPGPDNPLGSFWIGLDAPGYGIHGTIAPASVYAFQSHGCIRLRPDDIAQLFPRVSKGLIVKIIYTPLLMTDIDGHVFIEANRDIYRRAPYSLATLRRLAAANKMTDRINWQEAKMIVVRQYGVAEEAGFKATK